MIYPNNFENKIGFSEIRQMLSANCMCGLGRKKVEDMAFSTDARQIREWLEQIGEFKRYVLDKAIEEIEKAQSWKIETANVKTGRNITAIHFKVWSEIGFANRNRIRELTPDEQAEYENLASHAQQISLFD